MLAVIILVVVCIVKRRQRSASYSSDTDHAYAPMIDPRPRVETESYMMSDFEVPEQGTMLKFQTIRGRDGTQYAESMAPDQYM